MSAKAPNKIETMKKDYIKGEIEKLREKRVQVKEKKKVPFRTSENTSTYFKYW